MKRKELKNLAIKIAKYEKIVQANLDEKEVEMAKQQIMELSSKVKSLEDMIALDDLIQEFLEK
jgi:hypothetical protein